jgi:hypothetical protein
MGEIIKAYRFFLSETLKKRDYFEDLGTDGRTILKYLKEI